MVKKTLIKILILSTVIIAVIVGVNLFNEQRMKNLRVDTSKDRVVQTKFTNISKEYKNARDTKVDLFYFKDSNLPFIDVEEYIWMLNGVYYSQYFEFNKNVTDEILDVTFEVEYDDGEVLSHSINFDFKKDLISLESLDFFDIYIVQTATNYSEGLKNLEPRITEGESVTYELGKYDFDMVVNNKKFLVPLHVINLLFNQSAYFDVYYNSDRLYGIDTSDLGKTEIQKIIKSNNNKNDVPEDIRLATYNYLAFTLNYFYGLKSDKGIINGYDFISEYQNDFMNSDIGKAVFDVTTKLDDLHTSHLMRGYYNYNGGATTYDTENQGSNIKAFYNGLANVQQQAIKHFGLSITGNIKIKDHELIDNGKTAIIYLTGFEVKTPNDIKKIMKKFDDKVENVIIDLTLNTGGNLGAVLRMFAMMTDEEIWYHAQNPLDKAKVSYGVTGDVKAEFSNYNYYIKTSSVTFSAANLTASIAKELGIPVIGQKSSGGASSIGFFVLPDGSIIIMSSNMILSRLEEGIYYSIENGIEPDYLLKDLYDEKEIIDVILKNQ
ncbi:S41 family peptidase [Haploplasma axanthum]|uniref:Transmembrane protein and tail specific protease n=1 Tax=Haploplasma axanthum TaxID=29552 RepID=A0A449BDD7_HAPAX|nr:S41 family peptidase [Haploplasma axanthum]VEU80320.1 transmembrane protein and tail specific protease [Haploplasma axanthum]